MINDARFSSVWTLAGFIFKNTIQQRRLDFVHLELITMKLVFSVTLSKGVNNLRKQPKMC